MFFAKIPRHTRQNAITEGDLECILTRNCEGTEQLRPTSGIFAAVFRCVVYMAGSAWKESREAFKRLQSKIE